MTEPASVGAVFRLEKLGRRGPNCPSHKFGALQSRMVHADVKGASALPFSLEGPPFAHPIAEPGTFTSLPAQALGLAACPRSVHTGSLDRTDTVRVNYSASGRMRLLPPPSNTHGHRTSYGNASAVSAAAQLSPIEIAVANASHLQAKHPTHSWLFWR